MAPDIAHHVVSQGHQLHLAQQLPTVEEVGLEAAVEAIVKFFRAGAHEALDQAEVPRGIL